MYIYTSNDVIDIVKAILGDKATAYTNDQYDLVQELVDSDLENITGLTANDIGVLSNNVKIDMMLWRLGKLGADGLNSYSAAGVSENYQADYPENIMRQLRAKRRVKML